MEPDTAFGGVTDVRAADPRELYAACYDRLVRVLTLVAGDRAEAEDVVQEAFVRLVPRWSKISAYDDPEAWVRAVAFRILSNRFRRARNAVVAARRSADIRRGVDHVAETSSDGVDIARALALLPVGQRQVVVMHHLLDLPVEEIARALGVPVGTVKSRLSRARVALAPLLHEGSPDHV
ncbi:MAG TPA: SigE family RNA polymerase sigma factor [Acidothermaceae bacterium]